MKQKIKWFFYGFASSLIIVFISLLVIDSLFNLEFRGSFDFYGFQLRAVQTGAPVFEITGAKVKPYAFVIEKNNKTILQLSLLGEDANIGIYGKENLMVTVMEIPSDSNNIKNFIYNGKPDQHAKDRFIDIDFDGKFDLIARFYEQDRLLENIRVGEEWITINSRDYKTANTGEEVYIFKDGIGWEKQENVLNGS